MTVGEYVLQGGIEAQAHVSTFDWVRKMPIYGNSCVRQRPGRNSHRGVGPLTPRLVFRSSAHPSLVSPPRSSSTLAGRPPTYPSGYLVSAFCLYLSMSSALARYESFLVAHVSTISSLESSLRSITWILPGRFKDAELASEAR